MARVFRGGPGDDTFNVDDPADFIAEDVNAGTDTVNSTVHFRLPENVEILILQGSADLQGYGNSLNNVIYGNGGSNLLNGDVGADFMIGGAGNDVYFVDNVADAVFENPGEGSDTVFSVAHFRLTENVENLILQGNADVLMPAQAEFDTLVFHAGEANGDKVVGYNTGFPGDMLEFLGFGTAAQGATLTHVGATNDYQIHSGLDGHNEVITLINSAPPDAGHYQFL